MGSIIKDKLPEKIQNNNTFKKITETTIGDVGNSIFSKLHEKGIISGPTHTTPSGKKFALAKSTEFSPFSKREEANNKTKAINAGGNIALDLATSLI